MARVIGPAMLDPSRPPESARPLAWAPFVLAGVGGRDGRALVAVQSGKSKNLHQPLGLMSPRTTSQDRGGRNKVQAAQLKPLFGRS